MFVVGIVNTLLLSIAVSTHVVLTSVPITVVAVSVVVGGEVVAIGATPCFDVVLFIGTVVAGQVVP